MKTKQPPTSIQRHTTKPTNVPTKRNKKKTKNTNQPLRRQQRASSPPVWMEKVRKKREKLIQTPYLPQNKHNRIPPCQNESQTAKTTTSL